MEFEYSNPDQQVTTITRVSYRVLRREEFINDNFTTTNPFWSHDWDVGMAFPGGKAYHCRSSAMTENIWC